MLGVNLSLPVGELYGPFSVGSHPLNRPVGKHALLRALRVEILDRLVREDDFLGFIRVMLLDLVAGDGDRPSY